MAAVALFILTTWTILAGEVFTAGLIGSPSAKRQNVEYGGAFSILCSPDSIAAAIDLKWYGPHSYNHADSESNLIKKRSEMPVIDGNPSRIYTLASGSSLRLFVTELRDIDTGIYNCTGRVNNIPSNWSFELQAYEGLEVNAAPQQILIYQQDSVLECEVKSNPPPYTAWNFNNEFIDPLNNPEKYETSPRGLTVKNVIYADGGEYECIGSVQQGDTIVRKISVDVVSIPEMTSPPVNTSGIAYRDARIFCGASSTPPPTYRWFLGTRESSAGYDVSELGDRFRVSERKGDLTIINVQVDDEHWYWCKASNRADEVEGKAYFEVQVFPVFSDDVNLNKTETEEGGIVEMICQSQAKPNAKMAFQKEGSSQPYVNGYQPDDQRIYVYEKPSSAQVENQLIIPQEVVIRINATTPNDTANYTCLAENSAGKNQTNMHIIIRHKPNCDLMTPEMFTQCIWEDHPRNITALISGFPQPSVSWNRGDGRQILPDESAFQIFLEPYWENGRRDEWMANLQINWLVTKDGIQGGYAPTGNYFPIATNNVGPADADSCIINVVEADLPERVSSVTAVKQRPREITLSAEPPMEDNCIPVIAFEVIYNQHGTNNFEESELFTLAQRHEMKIKNLQAAVTYSLQVYARNERGRGIAPNSLIVTTNQSTSPEEVSIISNTTAFSWRSHQVVWREPEDGGEIIKNYRISWRKVGTTEWESRYSVTGSYYFPITDLEPDTLYELMVQAQNVKGFSPEPSPLPTFRTLPDPSGSKQEVVLQLHFIIIIAVLGLLAVLIALDMICFCSINRGILAMICGGISSDKELKKQEFVPLSGGFDYSNSQASLQLSSVKEQKVGETLSDTPVPHEYVNTARLQSSRPATSERPIAPQRTNTNARPVAPPRVPSRYGSEQPYHQYQPTTTPHPPIQSYKGNQENDIDYHERLRYTPAPRPAGRSTMM
ncbi:fasciclin-2-like [Watersipora subatra]|uniref:fasciclin-2-like n=1 Tax=Watersipora subatra TaxID=2589382 RepID=UPI00355C0EBE